MRKLVVTEFLSLDGVYQAPGAPDEDREGGFEHGGWQMPYFDDIEMESASKGMAETDAMLFGRKTFEIFAAYWPNADPEDPFSKHLNGVQKYVASSTLSDPEWGPTTVIRDVPTEVAALKDTDGGTITVLGSGNLVQSLAANDLVDEYHLSVYPITLGGGKRLFPDDGAIRTLELTESTPTSKGGLLLTYRPQR